MATAAPGNARDFMAACKTSHARAKRLSWSLYAATSAAGDGLAMVRRERLVEVDCRSRLARVITQRRTCPQLPRLHKPPRLLLLLLAPMLVLFSSLGALAEND